MHQKENPLGLDALAGESHKGADDAAVLPVRLDRYSRAHHRALDMADYARSLGHVKESRGLSKCGHHLLFRDYYQVGKVRLHAADFCRRHLLCPLCAIRRGAKLVQAYLARLQVVQAKTPNLRAFLVTVTVKNGSDLGERFNHLKKSMARMTQARRSYLRGKGPHIEMSKALGSVGSYEFKRGKGSGDWHPHAHMVWLCHETPDPEKLSREWLHFTGDSYIVDVRPFYDQEDITGGFLEVFKYAVKFSDLPLEDNWLGYETLKGRNLVFSLGSFRGVDVPDEMTDEQLDDQPYIELLFRFVRSAGYTVERVGKHQPPLVQRPDRPSVSQAKTKQLSHERIDHARISRHTVTSSVLSGEVHHHSISGPLPGHITASQIVAVRHGLETDRAIESPSSTSAMRPLPSSEG